MSRISYGEGFVAERLQLVKRLNKLVLKTVLIRKKKNM
jgi:hypothetical protein